MKAVLLGPFDAPGLLKLTSFVFLTEVLFLLSGHWANEIKKINIRKGESYLKYSKRVCLLEN